MGRGGQREGSGRKSGWKHSETQTIRVPKIFATEILDYARQLDTGSETLEPVPETLEPVPETLEPVPETLVQFESDAISELPPVQEVVPGQTSIFDFIDSVSESKLGSLRGIDLAQRFGVNKGVPSHTKGRFKDNREAWLAWTRKHDPEGLAWEYDPIAKRYFILREVHEDSVQVNPPWNTGLSDVGAREDMPRKGLTADSPAKLSV
jgi:hypothetical protein